MEQILMIWVAVSPFVVAILLGRRLRKSARLRREGTRVPGTIVSATTKRTNNRTTCKLVFRFETEDGRVVDPVPTTRSGAPKFHGGQSITVAYDPEDPESAEIMELGSETKQGVILIAVYAIGCAVAVIHFWDRVF